MKRHDLAPVLVAGAPNYVRMACSCGFSYGLGARDRRASTPTATPRALRLYADVIAAHTPAGQLPVRARLVDAVREDGHGHVTEVVGTTPCEECGVQLDVRREGRPRRFCNSSCRSRHCRRTPALPGL